MRCWKLGLLARTVRNFGNQSFHWIKVFMWQLYQDAILSRENMRKKIGLGTLSVLSVGILRLTIIFSLPVALLKVFVGVGCLCRNKFLP
jgi:hypothetical protein